MDGVTILREISVKTQSILPFFIIAGIAFICLITFIILRFKTNEVWDSGIVGCTFIMIFCLTIGICEEQNNKEILKQKYYDVLIDDSVTVNEFFKHYEIKKINGKIYTIKEIRSID